MVFSIALVSYVLLAVCVLLPVLWFAGVPQKIAYNLVGVLLPDERKKFVLLALTFLSIIGVYTMMKLFKDAFFIELVGARYISRAKLVSPIVFTLVLLMYNKIIPLFRKHRLFLVVCSIYSLVFASMGYLYSSPLMVLNLPILSWIPGKFLGWAGYIIIESFGGLVVNALFWAFVASTTTTESAKRGYPLVFLMAQVGNFCAAAFISQFSVALGFHGLFYLASVIVLIIPIIVEALVRTISPELMKSDAGGRRCKKKTGVFEGARLIATHPYVAGLVVIATFYEIVGTILDIQFKSTIASVYSGTAIARFMGYYGLASGTVALLFALVGTNFVVRNLGAKRGVLVYPALLSMTVVLVWMHPSLASFFLAMLSVKAFAYTLNNPVKELFYLPTSDDVKFKAKSFIDGIGGKSSKAVGAGITDILGKSILTGGALACGAVIGVWFAVALAMGTRYEKLIKSHEIVE